MQFKHEDVPWKSLEKFGLTPEKLRENGNYDRLLNGDRTTLIYTNSFDGTMARFEQGKFFLQKKSDGTAMLMYDGVKAAPAIPNEYKGHTFSKEEKEDLYKLKHMGRTVDMMNPDGKMKPYFVSIDKDTNTMLRWEASKFKAPENILGAHVSKEEQAMLREGRPVFIAGMKDSKGQEFSAYVVPDAINKKMAFIQKGNMLDRFLAPEHRAQVNRNNKGITDEKNKNIQGTAKTKQTGEKETDIKQKSTNRPKV